LLLRCPSDIAKASADIDHEMLIEISGMLRTKNTIALRIGGIDVPDIGLRFPSV
jgi:hypothetical protein